MAHCAQWASTSVGTVLVQASGDGCTDAVVLTPAEYASLSTNPLNLSLVEGAQISGAIAGIWAIAWCFKQLAKSINLNGDSTKE